MPPKTLLTAQATDEPVEHLQPIIDFAREIDAHLDVVVIGLIVPIPATVYGLGVDVAWKERPEDVRQDVANRIETVERLVQRAGLSATVVAEFPEIGSIDRAIARHALTADLTIFPHGTVLHDATANEMFEGALQGTGRAVLVLGRAGPALPAKRAVVAWDGSTEAARAVRESVPFLAPGCAVRIVAIDPSPDRAGPNAGNDIAAYLARHGAKVEIEKLPSEGRRPGDLILERVRDADADLLIMGAFAHPRLRRWLIGGATHDVMAKVDVTVLAAH